MITPQEIKKKAEKKYFFFLQTLTENKTFEKLIIRGDKKYTKSSLLEFEKEIQLIVSQSKEKKGFGYTLQFRQVKTKYLNTQDLPVSIFFDTEMDYLKFLGKEKEVELFKASVDKITNKFPELKEWIIKNPVKVITNEKEWESILKVCQYFRLNPKPDLYIRELPISVHTKFIEKNQGIIKDLLDVLMLGHINEKEKLFEKRFNLKYAEPQIRFRILDKEISQKYFSGIDDIAIPISQFETLDLPVKRVMIFENKTNLYTALTLPKMDRAIALFGSGFSVSNLKKVSWFVDKEILYWGDMDVQGFEILSQCRSYFSHTQSILMDEITFKKFFENDNGSPTNISIRLNLTQKEQQLYEILKINNWRLEQEKIPLFWVKEFFDQNKLKT